MDRQMKNGQTGHRRGGIFTLLAWVLFVVTLVGLISRCFGGSALEGALAKTEKRMQERERELLFLLSAAFDGSLTFEGEGMALDWNAALADGAYTLTATEGKNRISFYADSDRVTAAGTLFPDGARSAPASGAAISLAGSALDREGVSPEHFAFFQTLLSLAEPALCDSETVSEGASRIYRKAKPSVTSEKGDLIIEEKNVLFDVTVYRCDFDSAALVRALNALVKEGQEQAFRDAVLSRRLLLSSALGQKPDASFARETEDFLQAKGDSYEALSRLVGKSDSFLSVYCYVDRGAVAKVSVIAALGEHRFNFDLFLGTDEVPEESLSLLYSKGEETRLQLNLSHRILDDSESAFIREWTWTASDPTGILFSEGTDTEGSLRYSWGRTKGDLGLKLVQGENSLVLRGTLLSYKEEKELRFRLNRVEENGNNLLPCDEVEVKISRSASLEQVPNAKKSLFPDGEEKESFGQKAEEAYRTVFAGGTV